MTARTTLRRRLVVPGLRLGALAAGPLLHAGESDDESGTDRSVRRARTAIGSRPADKSSRKLNN